MFSSPHIEFVLISYGVFFGLLAGLAIWILASGATANRRLSDLEEQLGETTDKRSTPGQDITS